MQQDHTLFVILGHEDETPWVEKATYLRSRGGMVLIDTHPDYMVGSHILTAYDRFLAHFQNAPDVWKALPTEASAWWRRRADSHLVRDGAGWRVAGPAAAQARVQMLAPATGAMVVAQ